MDNASQEKPEDGDIQLADEDEDILTMKLKKMPMPPPGTPRRELEDLADGSPDKGLLRYSPLHAHATGIPLGFGHSSRRKVHCGDMEGPAAFDKKTAEIEKSLTATEMHRGGSSFRIHGDYTVELASQGGCSPGRELARWRQDSRWHRRKGRSEEIRRQDRGKEQDKP
jgi:hypothetical protein